MRSDFEMGEGAQSAFQHDGRRQEDGTITIFDNGAHPEVHDQSRGRRSAKGFFAEVGLPLYGVPGSSRAGA